MLSCAVLSFVILIHGYGSLALEPVRVPPVVINETSATCPDQSRVESGINTADIQVQDALLNVLSLLDYEFGPPPCLPQPCGSTGWTTMAYLNMMDPSETCPGNLTLIDIDAIAFRGCGRKSAQSDSCDSVFFPSNGIPYSKVCGQVTAYQSGFADAFEVGVTTTIEGTYLSGVSLTHGNSGSRKHVWSFVVTDNKLIGSDFTSRRCPCNTDSDWPHAVPALVGRNYYCDSGTTDVDIGTLYPDDPLWDGAGCVAGSTCCDDGPDFCTTLPQPTSDDLELRICNKNGADTSDVIISLVDIYTDSITPA